jgi:hypothetical protein
MKDRISAELSQFFVIIVFEHNKWKKLKRRWAGIRDGLKYKVEK